MILRRTSPRTVSIDARWIGNATTLAIIGTIIGKTIIGAKYNTARGCACVRVELACIRRGLCDRGLDGDSLGSVRRSMVRRSRMLVLGIYNLTQPLHSLTQPYTALHSLTHIRITPTTSNTLNNPLINIPGRCSNWFHRRWPFVGIQMWSLGRQYHQ